MNRILSLAASLLLTACFASSGDVVSKTVIYKKSAVGVAGSEEAFSSRSWNGTCYRYRSYTIISKTAKDSVGSDTLVKAAGDPKTACKWDEKGALLLIKNVNAEYFFGLSGAFLFLDSGTAADARTFMIYDLGAKKKVFSSPYSGTPELKNGKLSFWSGNGAADKTNCPDYGTWTANGLSAVIETESLLDLSTMKVVPTGKTRCSARQ